MAKLLAITAISVSSLLVAAVIILNVHEINHNKLSTTTSGSCNCDEIKADRSLSSVKDSLVANSKFYEGLIKERVGAWKGKKTDISVFSAFEYPHQTNVIMTSIAKYGDKIYCRYFDKSMRDIGNSFKSVVFPEYTVMCLRREGARFISLSDTASGQYDYPVPITDRTQYEPTHFFSICLAPIYGLEPKWLQLAELVEHYKIQGATHFYIYLIYIDEYSRMIVDDYVRTGDAEVIILHDRFERKDDRWQSMQLQECLNRARGHSRWVAFVDLDERLTPTNYSGTLRSYLHGLSNDKVGGIELRMLLILRNEKFPAKYKDANQVAEWMPQRRFRNTSGIGIPWKCIIDPKKVLSMRAHRPDAFFEGYLMQRMRPEKGVVRHYRDVNTDNWRTLWLPRVEHSNFTMTDYPERWAKELLLKVQERVHHVYGGQT